MAKSLCVVAVARFAPDNQQLMLIAAFARLVQTGHFADWRLQLVGARCPQPEALDYLSQCVEKAQGLAIDFVFSPTEHELRELYGQAAVYWHGTGLGVDEASAPERLDRAGLSALEALSAGCKVFIPNSGTVREWCEEAQGEVYLCADVDVLVDKMLAIVCSALPVVEPPAPKKKSGVRKSASSKIRLNP
jgi:glycosyltransferase involved in cell wall biosynthesis